MPGPAFRSKVKAMIILLSAPFFGLLWLKIWRCVRSMASLPCNCMLEPTVEWLRRRVELLRVGTCLKAHWAAGTVTICLRV